MFSPLSYALLSSWNSPSSHFSPMLEFLVLTDLTLEQKSDHQAKVTCSCNLAQGPKQESEGRLCFICKILPSSSPCLFGMGISRGKWWLGSRILLVKPQLCPFLEGEPSPKDQLFHSIKLLQNVPQQLGGREEDGMSTTYHLLFHSRSQ